MSLEPSRRGLSTGDVLLVLAVACLALALAYPAIARARVLRRVDDLAANVDSLRAAAEGLPAELEGVAYGELRMEAPGYRLGWEVWEAPAPPTPGQPPSDTLDLPPPPRPDALGHAIPRTDSIAAITVYTGDARILRLLLDRYGEKRSFVRDSSWTLILRGGEDGG